MLIPVDFFLLILIENVMPELAINISTSCIPIPTANKHSKLLKHWERNLSLCQFLNKWLNLQKKNVNHFLAYFLALGIQIKERNYYAKLGVFNVLIIPWIMVSLFRWGQMFHNAKPHLAKVCSFITINEGLFMANNIW